jgi:hypothetical protein
MTTFTKTERAKAEWALKVYQESGRTRTTARAMHYFCLGRTDYPLFNRTGKQYDERPFTDSDDDNITEWIALAKRQGLLSWDAIRDETVSEEGVVEYIPHHSDFSYNYSNSFPYFSLSDLRRHLKSRTFECHTSRVERDQPYHLELWVEKNTMNSMLKPVSDRYDAALITFKGQPSWGAVQNLCNRAAQQDPRPTLVFYLSDLDVYGFLMASQMSEKVDELNKEFFEGRLDIRVRRIGLTPEQVREYKIPLVKCAEPKKKKKNGDPVAVANRDRFNAYVSPFGFDHTKKAELDALERYFPGGVTEFAASWLSKFYDSTLNSRCIKATEDLTDAMPPTPELPDEIIDLRSKLLMGLEELIAAEEELAIPDGGYEDSDVDPITENPNDTAWLLDTSHGVCPQSSGDVDFTTEGTQP